jgi:hypothetical protein
MEINESLVFLRLDPSREPTQKDLPVYLYESGTPCVCGAAISLQRCLYSAHAPLKPACTGPAGGSTNSAAHP